MILSYYYTGIHKDELPAFEKKAKKLQAEYKSFVVGAIERTMRVHYTGNDLAECEKKASVFRKAYANKEMLDFMREQETNRSLEQINESNDRFWREFRLAK
jgi:hypothetical protein